MGDFLANPEKSPGVRKKLINEMEQGQVLFQTCPRPQHFMPSSYLNELTSAWGGWGVEMGFRSLHRRGSCATCPHPIPQQSGESESKNGGWDAQIHPKWESVKTSECHGGMCMWGWGRASAQREWASSQGRKGMPFSPHLCFSCRTPPAGHGGALECKSWCWFLG